MTKLRFLLIGIVASVVLLGSSSAFADPVINGGFEMGDLRGWTTSIPAGGAIDVVTSCSLTTTPFCYDSFSPHQAREGSRYALLSPSAEGVLTVLSQAVMVPAGTVISGWVFFFDAEEPTETIFCDEGTVGVVLNGSTQGAPVLFRANSCATANNASSGWTFFEWRTPGPGVLQIHGTVVNKGDSLVPSRLGLDGIQLVEPPTRQVGGGAAAVSGATGTRDNLARQAAKDATAQQSAQQAAAAAVAASQPATGALRPPNTGDAGLLDHKTQTNNALMGVAAVLCLSLVGAGLVRLRRS